MSDSQLVYRKEMRIRELEAEVVALREALAEAVEIMVATCHHCWHPTDDGGDCDDCERHMRGFLPRARAVLGETQQ